MKARTLGPGLPNRMRADDPRDRRAGGGRLRRRRHLGGQRLRSAGGRQRPVQGKLTVSQWPLYVDPGPDGTVAQFQHDTGVDVNWVEDINDNDAFFAKLQPLLAKGESGGRSLITVSDWPARRMYDIGYLQKLDYSKLPNVTANLLPSLRHPGARPEPADLPERGLHEELHDPAPPRGRARSAAVTKAFESALVG